MTIDKNEKSAFSWIFRFGVRQKVMLILLSVLLLSLSVSGWLALKQEKENTLQEINQRGADISQFVAKSLAFSVVGYDYHTIQLLLDEVTLSEEIDYAKVVNEKGNSMAESGTMDDSPTSTMVMFSRDILLEESLVGKLDLGFSTAGTINRLEKQKYSLIVREVVIILLIALGEFLALSFIIVRPVSVMSKSLKNSVTEDGKIVGSVPVISRDEFGQLAEQFNKLSAQLNDANHKLQTKIDMSDQELIKNNRQLFKQSEELKQISDEFKRMSMTDALTGIYNRRHFEELIHTETEMAQQHEEEFSLLIIDIDYFKKINDDYGHPCGDCVLIDVARTLKASLRKTDIICRVGGEEFAAICKRADKAVSIDIAEKLRTKIEALTTQFEDQQISVTISVGVASLNIDSSDGSTESLYRRADIAVYHSKTNGRNRITHFSDIAADLIHQNSPKQSQA